MARGLRGVPTHVVEGEASSNHEAMSPHQIQQTRASTQPTPKKSVMPIIQPAPTAQPQKIDVVA